MKRFIWWCIIFSENRELSRPFYRTGQKCFKWYALSLMSPFLKWSKMKILPIKKSLNQMHFFDCSKNAKCVLTAMSEAEGRGSPSSNEGNVSQWATQPSRKQTHRSSKPSTLISTQSSYSGLVHIIIKKLRRPRLHSFRGQPSRYRVPREGCQNWSL